MAVINRPQAPQAAQARQAPQSTPDAQGSHQPSRGGMSYAKVTVIGNTGNEPELRYTPSGAAVCGFSMAVNRRQGETQYTDWYRVSAWGKLAELVESMVGKGTRVLVDGRLAQRQWTDRDGVARLSVEITADTVVVLAGGKDRVSGEQDAVPDDDDVPF